MKALIPHISHLQFFANLFGWIWLLPLFTMWSYKQQQKQALKIFMLTNVEFFSKKSVICLNWQGKIRIKKFFHCEVCNIPWLTWSNKNQKKYWDFKLVFKGSSKLYIRTMKTMVFSVGLHCTNFLYKDWTYSLISKLYPTFPPAKNFLKESDTEKKVNSSKVSEYGKLLTDCLKSDHLKKQAD